jgi:hypothetical protein
LIELEKGKKLKKKYFFDDKLALEFTKEGR